MNPHYDRLWQKQTNTQADRHTAAPPLLLNSHVQFNVSVNLLSWEQLCAGSQKSGEWPLMVSLMRSDWQEGKGGGRKDIEAQLEHLCWTIPCRVKKWEKHYTLFLFIGHFRAAANVKYPLFMCPQKGHTQLAPKTSAEEEMISSSLTAMSRLMFTWNMNARFICSSVIQNAI